MKLLYLHSDSITAEKANAIQVLQMCYAFSDLGHDVMLAVPDEGHCSVIVKEKIQDKINKDIKFSIKTYPKITINGRLSQLGGYIGAGRLLKENRTDCCFIRNPVFVGQAIKNNIPTIFESHNALLHEKYKILDFICRKNLLKNIKSEYLLKFIVISNALGDVWKSRGIPYNKMIVLHDGFDSEEFSNIYDRKTTRKQLQVPLDRKIILYTGSLYENRGIEKILKLAELFPHVFFLVVGGPEEQKKHYIDVSNNKKIKNISFMGYVSHYKIREYLSAADILLMIWTKQVKTINFCSPLKMFEYMAAGRIIVGDGFPTIKEVLTDGKTAYLAEPDSFDSLYGKVSLALKESYPNAMAEAARSEALENYSWRTRAQVILDNIGGAQRALNRNHL